MISYGSASVFLIDTQIPLAQGKKKKRRGINMQQLLKDIVQDALSQLFGVSVPRGGSLTVTNHAFVKMADAGLSFDLITDAFRFGEEIEEGKIMRAYADFTIGLIYKSVQRNVQKGKGKEKHFVIITCWKGVRR
jgi:hypothetical protein